MKLFLVIIVTLCIFGCSSHSQNRKTIYNCTIKDTISQEDKLIDIEKYNDDLEKKRSSLILENDSTKIEIFMSKSDNEITKVITNRKNNIIKEINYNLTTKKIISYSFYYYTNNVLLLGKKYNYDTKGNVIKVIDHDDPEHYPLCYKEAEAIVMKKVGKKYQITGIGRESKIINNKTIYYWEVVASIIGSYKYSDAKEIWLDAKTGKIIKIAKMHLSKDDYLEK